MASKPSGIRPPGAIKAPANPSASVLPRPSGLPMMRRGLSSLSQTDPENSTVAGANSTVNQNATDTPLSIDNFIIGDTVWVGGVKRGRISYIGETQFAKGEWAGVVLDDPLGKNDGTVSGCRYFQCEPLHGTFTRLNRLSRKPTDPESGFDGEASMMNTPAKALEKLRSPSPTSSLCKSPSPGVGTPTRLGSPAPIKLGDRVIVQSTTGTKRGVLRFMGNTDFAAGDWAGIELDQPVGKNDGAVGGRRYFQCRDKYGLFAPISKVSSSPMNRRPSSSNLRRQSSRESLISNISSASSVAPGSSRKASAHMRTQCLPSCSLQIVLKENEKHTEQLMKERDLDRNELALITKQYDECRQELKASKLEYLRLQQECTQELASHKADTEVVTSLKFQLEEEYRRYEDLLFGLEEEKIAKSDLQAQLDAFTDLDAHKVQFEKEIAELKLQLESTNQNLNSKSIAIEEKVNELNEANRNVEKLKQEIAEGMSILTDTIQKYENQLKSVTEVAKNEQDDMDKGFKDLESLVDSKEQTIKNAQEEQEKLKNSAQELTSKLQKSVVECERLREHKSRLEDEVMNLVTSSSSSSGVLTEKLIHKDEEISQLRERIEAVEVEEKNKQDLNIAKHQSEKESWLKSEAGLKEEINKLTVLMKKSNAELKQEKLEITTLNNSVAAKKQAMEKREQAFTVEKEKLESEYSNKLKKVQETAENSIAQLKQLVQDSQQSFKAKIELMSTEKVELEKINKILQKQIADINKQFGEDRKSSESLVETMKTQLANLSAERTEQDSIFRELSSKLDIVNITLEEYEKNKKANDSHIMELTTALNTLREDITHHETNKVQLENTLVGLNQSSEAERESLKSIICEKERENNLLKGSLAKFEVEVTHLKEENAFTKTQLKEKDIALLAFENDKMETRSKNSEAAVPDTVVNTDTHINFLNSIVVDLQKKNEDLAKKLDIVLNGGRLSDANYNTVGGGPSTLTNPQAPRLYCDICEQFDLHDTEDCPTQESEPNSHHNMPRGGTRPYCDTCEVFGHWTKDCDDGETF